MNFKNIAIESLEIEKKRASFWRNCDKEKLAQEITAEEIALLKELIIGRVDVLNSFELLCRVDKEEAISVLIRCYLGKGVCLYSKFGGTRFELSTILDDIVELYGKESLRNILKLDAIDKSKLVDEQVLLSFSEALDLDIEETKKWLAEPNESDLKAPSSLSNPSSIKFCH